MFVKAEDVQLKLRKGFPVFVCFSMSFRPRDRPFVSYEALVRLSLGEDGELSFGSAVFDKPVRQLSVLNDRFVVEFSDGAVHRTDRSVRYFTWGDTARHIARGRTRSFVKLIRSQFGELPIERLASPMQFADAVEITQEPFLPRGVICRNGGERFEIVSDDVQGSYVLADSVTWSCPSGVHGTLKSLGQAIA